MIKDDIRERGREAFAPQRPYRAPWGVIWSLLILLAFVAGHLLWRSNDYAQYPHKPVVDALSEVPLENGPASAGAKLTSLPAATSVGANPVADVVANVAPSVVSIDTTIREQAPSLPDFLFSKPGASKGGRMHESESYEAHGEGSGIVVRSDGYVLTNYHVVKGAQDIRITLNDGRVLSGQVVGHDGYTDVALVKINADNLHVARLGSSKSVRPGDWAIAIGSPLGLSHTVTMGIVSAIGRSLADLNNNVDLIQTDAAINPGNSGGPLLNIRGEVVGINMAIRTDAQNIGFSIPIDTAREAATAIIAHRPIVRPYLGVSMIDFDPELARTIGIPSDQSGAMVSKVESKSPAASSGLAQGDLIERIDNLPVHDGGDVQREVRAKKVGNLIRLQIFHAGQVRNIAVQLRPYPDEDGSNNS